MKKSILVLLSLLFIITGCGDKKESNNKKTNNEPQPAEEKINIDELVFPLYKKVSGSYVYYNNKEIYALEPNIIIDTTNKMVIDFSKKELLNYDEFIKSNPIGDIREFVLLNNRCRQEVFCDNEFGCEIPNYGIEALQEEIDPINGVTPNYLVEEWCPIEINDELIKQINSLDEVEVIGREIPNKEGRTIKNSIAIKLPYDNTVQKLNNLFKNYGLLNIYDSSVEGYTKYPLREDICNRMNIKCEKIDE